MRPRPPWGLSSSRQFYEPHCCLQRHESASPGLRHSCQGTPHLYNIPFLEQAASWPFIMASVYLGYLIFVANFTIATVHDQLKQEVMHRGSGGGAQQGGWGSASGRRFTRSCLRCSEWHPHTSSPSLLTPPLLSPPPSSSPSPLKPRGGHTPASRHWAGDDSSRGGDAEQTASLYTFLFTLILPWGALFVPVVGYLLVKFGIIFSFTLAGLANTTFLLVCLPNLLPIQMKVRL